MQAKYRKELERLAVEVKALRDDLDNARGPSAVVEGEVKTHYLAPATVTVTADSTECFPQGSRFVTVKVDGGHGPATGLVYLYDNGHSARASKELDDGEATFRITFPLRSRHVYSARYAGDTVYEAQAESSSVAITVA